MVRKKAQKKLFNQARQWWQTDTAKAVATVIAVLLIPASVIAWNYTSNKEANIDDLNLDLEAMEDETTEKAVPDATQVDEPEEPAPLAGDVEVGGLNDLTTLPNTSSADTYVVQKGDSIYSISLEMCGNESFYRSNMNKNYLKVGQEIRVYCE